MKVFGLQGEIMRSARLSDKIFDDPEVVFCLRQLERFERLRKTHGLTAAQAAEILRVSRATLYCWRRHLAEAGTSGLRSRSRRPRRVRQRQWDMRLAEAVRQLRDQGFAVSDSTVGRILHWLKARDRLPGAPVRGGRRRHGRPWRHPWARRAPCGLKGEQPGDLVQVDVLAAAVRRIFSNSSRHAVRFRFERSRSMGARNSRAISSRPARRQRSPSMFCPRNAHSATAGWSGPTASGATSSMPVTRCCRRSGNCDPWFSGGNRSTTCCGPIRR